jgi:hypothetical protein
MSEVVSSRDDGSIGAKVIGLVRVMIPKAATRVFDHLPSLGTLESKPALPWRPKRAI